MFHSGIAQHIRKLVLRNCLEEIFHNNIYDSYNAINNLKVVV